MNEQLAKEYVFDEIIAKRREIENVAVMFNNEFGSDEVHCNRATCDHSLRKVEMQATEGEILSILFQLIGFYYFGVMLFKSGQGSFLKWLRRLFTP